MEFSPWVLATDLGLAFLLLLLGKLLRAWIKPIQVLFLPAAIIAGLLGLALGPNGFNILPFSDQIGAYPGVLIAVLFAGLALGQSFNLRAIGGRIGALASYSIAMYVMMWGAGLLFALLVLNLIWDLPQGFGIMLASGFVGGHGTAAAVGTSFEGLGWAEAQSLAFTSATVGVTLAILGGLALAKWGARTGRTNVIADFDELPTELRTGLVPEERRESFGDETVSTMSLDPLAFHLGLVFLALLGGYYLAQLGETLFPALSIPIFAVAFLCGLALQLVMSRTGIAHYVDGSIVGNINASSTELLITFGIAAIQLGVVVNYIAPLTILLIFGILYCLLLFRFLAPRIFDEYSFERGIFTWGWSTGAVAMGIALLKVVDPKGDSKTLADFGIAYIPFAPMEVVIVTFAPILIVSGFSWWFALGTLAVGFGALAFARVMGWWAAEPSFHD